MQTAVLDLAWIEIDVMMLRDVMKPFRARCPNCDVVFEEPRQITLVHVFSTKLLTCPACNRSAMMDTNCQDEVTWPPKSGAAMPAGEQD